MKSFFAWIDVSLTTPQSIQHTLMKEKARRADGQVTFYGGEEIATERTQIVTLSKLRKAKELDGAVFFSLHQFRTGDELNFKLLRELLSFGLELHFARENISLVDVQSLDDQFCFLRSVDYTLRRDSSAEWQDFLALPESERMAHNPAIQKSKRPEKLHAD